MHLENSPGSSAFAALPRFTSARENEEPIQSNSSGPNQPGDEQLSLTKVVAENTELLAEVSRLRADRARLSAILSELTRLVGSKSSDRLVHDVRNVLNERELYRVLAEPHM